MTSNTLPNAVEQTAPAAPTSIDWETSVEDGKRYVSATLPDMYDVPAFAHVHPLDLAVDRAIVAAVRFNGRLVAVAVGVADIHYDIVGRWDEITADARRSLAAVAAPPAVHEDDANPCDVTFQASTGKYDVNALIVDAEDAISIMVSDHGYTRDGAADLLAEVRDDALAGVR